MEIKSSGKQLKRLESVWRSEKFTEVNHLFADLLRLSYKLIGCTEKLILIHKNKKFYPFF